MSNIFTKKEYARPTFFQHLFKIKPKENSIIEINNLLSEKNIFDLTEEDVKSISDSYKINLQKVYANDLLNFYKKHLEYNLRNAKLTETSLKESKHLIFILKLDENETGQIFEELTKNIYQNEVRKSISKGILEKEDEEKLLNMQENLLISKDIATNIYKENAELVISNNLEKAISVKDSPQQKRRI